MQLEGRGSERVGKEESRSKDPERVVIELTPYEVCILIDRIQGDDLSDGEDFFPAYSASQLQRLLLQFASAFVEVIDTKEPVSLALGVDDLWLLRGKVSCAEMDGDRLYGIEILDKLYRGLLSLNRWLDE